MGESIARVLLVGAGEMEHALAAAFAVQGFEVCVVNAVSAGEAMVDFVPDVLVIDLRDGDPSLTLREMTRSPVGVAETADGEMHGATRIKHLLAQMHPGGLLRSDDDDLLIDLDKGLAYRQGEEVALTTTELLLLAILVYNKNSVVSKARLLQLLRGPTASNVNVVEVHMSSLRRKLENLGPPLIRTVRGAGYLLGQGNLPASARVALAPPLSVSKAPDFSGPS